jgi:ABC-type glutathione transport system ATPase component
VSFRVEPGERLALIGPSGSGKTTLARALVRLLPPALQITSGRVGFEGRDLLQLSEGQLRTIRGRKIGFVFQEAASALNPLMQIGTQLREGLVYGDGLPRAGATRIVAKLLEEVAITDPKRCLDAYPNELSRGMKQRVLIAAALARDPELLICDEPTSSLDATVKAKVLRLLEEICDQRNLSIILITHDLQSTSIFTQRLLHLRQGRIAEGSPQI